jgi:acylphosphatase
LSGQVEIEAEGDKSLIEELLKMVRVGPRSARVTDMQIEWIKCKNNEINFEIQ